MMLLMSDSMEPKATRRMKPAKNMHNSRKGVGSSAGNVVMHFVRSYSKDVHRFITISIIVIVI
jgi:hypothetical protein